MILNQVQKKLSYKYRNIIIIYNDINKNWKKNNFNLDSMFNKLENEIKQELEKINNEIKCKKKHKLYKKTLIFFEAQSNKLKKQICEEWKTDEDINNKEKLNSKIETWFKKNPEDKWIKKIIEGHMHGVEEPWCNNQGVTILPFILKDNKYYFLQIFKENNALFNNKLSEYSSITGGLENFDPVKTAILEMYEETGINITNQKEDFFKKDSEKNIHNIDDVSAFISEKVNMYYLDNYYANKSSTKLWYFFGIDLTNLNLDLTKTYKGTGDNTVGEKEISAKFINDNEFINQTNDILALTVYAKLSYDRYKNFEQWWNNIIKEEKDDDQNAKLKKMNDSFLKEFNKIDESRLICSSTSSILKEKCKKISENLWDKIFKTEINLQDSNLINKGEKNILCQY